MNLRKLCLVTTTIFMLVVIYQALAAYLTSPENLQYPNPGHYPGEIGPGTFNCSNNANCFWRFPNALLINSSSRKVKIIGNATVQGDLEVKGAISTSYAPHQADINKDGYINSLDINLISKAFSVRKGQSLLDFHNRGGQLGQPYLREGCGYKWG